MKTHAILSWHHACCLSLCLALLSCQPTSGPTTTGLRPVSSLQPASEHFAELEAEYAGFATQALSQSYLERKVRTLIANNDGEGLRREIEFAEYKHPELLIDVMQANPELYEAAAAMPEIIEYRQQNPAFDSYMVELSGVPPVLPVITAFSLSSGSSGDEVMVSGENFTGINSLQFNGVEAPFTINSPTQITTYVPFGNVSTGTLSLSTASQTVHSETAFQIDSRILLVKPNAAGSGTGWQAAYTDLQAALDTAQAGDQIWLAEGIYTPTQPLNIEDPRDVSFVLKPQVSLYGGFAGEHETQLQERDFEAHLSILSGDLAGDDIYASQGVTHQNTAENAYRVVMGAQGARLDGLTIQGGVGKVEIDEHFQWGGGGGGLYNEDLSIDLEHVVFRYNGRIPHSIFGGAIYNKNSTSNLTHVLFQQNVATDGGAMFNYQSQTNLNQVIFSQNESFESGGGIYNSSESVLNMHHVIFDSNSSMYGGGVYQDEASSLTLENGVFTKNYASNEGGGLHCLANQELVLKNVVFSENTSMGRGAFFHLPLANTVLNHVTLYNNKSSAGGTSLSLHETNVVDHLVGAANINNLLIWNDEVASGLSETQILGDQQAFVTIEDPFVNSENPEGSGWFSCGAGLRLNSNTYVTETLQGQGVTHASAMPQDLSGQTRKTVPEPGAYELINPCVNP